MIFDVILVLIFLALIIFNAVRGAAKALAGIVSSLIAYAVATMLGKMLAVWIYDGFVRAAIDKAVIGALEKISAGAANTAAETLPQWLAGILRYSGTDLNALADSAVTQNAAAICDTVNTTVRPIVIGLISILATLVLFVLLLILLRFLVVKPLLKVFEFPGLRGINHFLGGVIGLVDAFLLVSLAAYLLKLLMPVVSTQSGWLNESTIYNSFIFYHFYSGNIFTAVTSIIG